MAKDKVAKIEGVGIDAMPTKELFIDMLTRDIGLIPAIIDLVDNSADGAKKITGEGLLENYWVRATVSESEFVVSDNCGGITVEIARKYAFRFGRPPGAPFVKHSVGQFGVGMKRAIFKIGRRFRVESTTAKTKFVVDVDVNEWAKQKEWSFKFEEMDESGSYKAEEIGTTITVTVLENDVANVFKLGSFIGDLRTNLASRLQDPIAKGLSVSLNGIPVNASHLTMLSNEQLAPAFKHLKYGNSSNGKKPVNVRLYCGLGRGSSKGEEREQAGWHVFCNGRLILEGDKTEVTGWGAEDDIVSIPGFHGQYNHLRGFAYFDSDDPSRLPWNTTKTGINTDSPIYRAVKLEMMTMMRPVVDFLNRLKEEKQTKNDPEEKGSLETLLDAAKPTPVTSVDTRKVFVAPTPKLTANKNDGPKLQKIQYEAPLDEVNQVMKVIKATTYKEVGEKTFRYFFNSEVDE